MKSLEKVYLYETLLKVSNLILKVEYSVLQSKQTIQLF